VAVQEFGLLCAANDSEDIDQVAVRRADIDQREVRSNCRPLTSLGPEARTVPESVSIEPHRRFAGAGSVILSIHRDRVVRRGLCVPNGTRALQPPNWTGG